MSSLKSSLLMLLMASLTNGFAQEFIAENGTALPQFNQDSGLLARPEYTIAGSLPTAERKTFSLNIGWRFFKGDVPAAQQTNFDDSTWELVNVPHGLETLPEEASGGINYRGVAWYRKHLNVPAKLQGKRVVLYFEGIMGKSEIFVNGKSIAKHFGGYLPIILNVSDFVEYGKENIIAVRADNSDDPIYPPGKPQDSLDFCYFGGIYRDVYLLATNTTHISDANEENIPAGGGVFFRTHSIDLEKGLAKVGLSVHVNGNSKIQALATLKNGKRTVPVKLTNQKTTKGQLFAGEAEFPINENELWSPDAPNLWELSVNLLDNTEKNIDSVRIPVGIRMFELSDKGLVLNGKTFPGKLIGANRHQDFAEIGNAVPNNLQWQDAVKLRAAGLRLIRCAHYPMDPAFMDACDRLGLFVIVATPGWQFWNNTPVFENRVYSDIRNMIRRDRNRPSVFMWEPILNESYYPDHFAEKAHKITHEEYPFPPCYTCCDQQSRGSQHYDVMFSHPPTGDARHAISAKKIIPGKPYFCREFGDNVDSWTAHNSPSRVSREWGEIPMLIQAKHYLKPDYRYTCWDSLFKADKFHIGGALWHPFDHQRGYHPDPFFGGILDAFRLPKYSYYGFMAQRPPHGNSISAGPVVKIAHAGTPFSPQDVTVYSNCEAVRLTSQGRTPIVKTVPAGTPEHPAIPHEPLVFEKAWDFQLSKEITRANRERASDKDRIVAEGLINGKVVCRDIISPSRRPSALKLSLDAQVPVEADGSSIFAVIATMVDENGFPKRLNNEEVEFFIEGPASIIGARERKITWGTAPVLVRTGTQAGQITVRAQLKYKGTQKPVAGELKFRSQPCSHARLFSEEARTNSTGKPSRGNALPKIDEATRRKKLEEVSAAQADFE